MILNAGGGPTPDKPTVTLSVPDPNHINSSMNFRVADVQACYELWRSRGAEFITEPIQKYGEALGFDSITSTLIFGEYDAALVDAMMTVAQAEALANWVALHKLRSRETDSISEGRTK